MDEWSYSYLSEGYFVAMCVDGPNDWIDLRSTSYEPDGGMSNEGTGWDLIDHLEVKIISLRFGPICV